MFNRLSTRKVKIQRERAYMLGYIPAVTTFAWSANSSSESPMACDTRVVDPAPLRQATTKVSPLLKHLRGSHPATHAAKASKKNGKN